MGGEEACCSHFTLLVRQRRVCPAVESPKKPEFLSGDRQQASLAFRFAPTSSSGHPLVAYLLEVTLLLARCVAQVCWVPFCHVWDICVFWGGGVVVLVALQLPHGAGLSCTLQGEASP